MPDDRGTTRSPIPLNPDTVFDRVIVTPHTRGGTLVTFWLRSVSIEGPYEFYLEWAEHPAVPEDEWVTVAGPITDNVLVDTEQRRFSKLPHSVYRVRMVAPGGQYVSSVNPVTGEWNRHDWKIAKETIRREYLTMQRYTGTRGVYLARKQWGEICSACADYNTDMVTRSDCPVCYGTGFVGGYHTPTTLWVQEERTTVRTQRDATVGVNNNQSQTARVVAFPFLTAEDVWVSSTTDERWFIQSKEEIAALRGKPLVWAVELRLAQPGNIIYDVPLTANVSSSSTY